LTGYLNNSATRPTTVMTASVEVKAPLPMELVSSVADPVRRSASRRNQDRISG
jgi:hypothetical protein